MVESGKVKPEQLDTQRFKLAEMLEAYDVFENATERKVINSNLRK